jgi:hypothetical protein
MLLELEYKGRAEISKKKLQSVAIFKKTPIFVLGSRSLLAAIKCKNHIRPAAV